MHIINLETKANVIYDLSGEPTKSLVQLKLDSVKISFASYSNSSIGTVYLYGMQAIAVVI